MGMGFLRLQQIAQKGNFLGLGLPEEGRLGSTKTDWDPILRVTISGRIFVPRLFVFVPLTKLKISQLTSHDLPYLVSAMFLTTDLPRKTHI
jgi:hypothetical protein